jgi:CelD/BcsL family acetyltransferase involved in cellulose biosynthesis
MLRLFLLRLDGRAVAFHLVLAGGGASFHLKSGFDEEHRKLAPGMLILAEILERGFADGTEARVVLGAVEPYKASWPGETRRWMLLQAFAPGAAGTLDWLAFAHGRPAAKRIKASAVRLRGDRGEAPR